MRYESDREIIAEIKKGNVELFNFIVKKYIGKVYQFINMKIFDKQEVDDLVQETFISFYKAVNRFDEDRPVTPYLLQIAKNQMKMYFRSKKKALPLDERLKIPAEEIDFFDKITKIDLDIAFNKLSYEQKKALQLVADGHSYEEIASQLDKPLNTVRSLIRRARLKISPKGRSTVGRK